jgi:hypothetical protein
MDPKEALFQDCKSVQEKSADISQPSLLSSFFKKPQLAPDLVEEFGKKQCTHANAALLKRIS